MHKRFVIREQHPRVEGKRVGLPERVSLKLNGIEWQRHLLRRINQFGCLPTEESVARFQ
ncbi:MAG: hypothetical protein AABW68_01445 [archaeon]